MLAAHLYKDKQSVAYGSEISQELHKPFPSNLNDGDPNKRVSQRSGTKYAHVSYP